jgi:hypothetical protein
MGKWIGCVVVAAVAAGAVADDWYTWRGPDANGISKETGLNPKGASTLWTKELTATERKLLWAGGPPFYRLRDGATYFSAEALARAMESFNDTLLEVCRERDLECLDAATRMERTTDNFYDDAHFTERGSATLAGLISDYLLARPPLKQ